MIRRIAQPLAARRAAVPAMSLAAASQIRCTHDGHRFAIAFKHTVRRNQLTQEDCDKVVVQQADWPEEFKNYDPEDPYKNCPDFFEGWTAFNFYVFGMECMFLYMFYEFVFPKAM